MTPSAPPPTTTRTKTLKSSTPTCKRFASARHCPMNAAPKQVLCSSIRLSCMQIHGPAGEANAIWRLCRVSRTVSGARFLHKEAFFKRRIVSDGQMPNELLIDRSTTERKHVSEGEAVFAFTAQQNPLDITGVGGTPHSSQGWLFFESRNPLRREI